MNALLDADPSGWWQAQLVLAVLAAAAAARAWLPPPPRRPVPVTGRPHPFLRRWPAIGRGLVWARGRNDGIPLKFRTVVAVLAVAAIAVLAQAVGLAWWLGWLLGCLTGFIGWIALGRIESDAHRMRRMRLTAELPHACDLLAAGLSAGLPLRRAVDVVVEAMPGVVAEDLDEVLGLIEAGESEPVAWRQLSRRPGANPWRRLAIDLARSVESGTAVSQTLHHHAEATRAAAQAAREAHARTAGVRSVLPLMLCFLPSFFLIGVLPIVASLLLRLF